MAEETKRGLANIRAVWGIWLDNDGGDLTHEEFARLFPRLRMVIINSYSSTPENPRWRVFIPTTVAMPIAAHKAIAEQIMHTLNRAGYWSKKQLETNDRIKSRRHHGFDMGKLAPSSLFYLPCQAADPTGSFFIDRNGRDRQPIDPYVWAAYATNHHRPSPEPVETREPKVVGLKPPQIPPTECPRLRRMRELIAEEDAANADSIRAKRQAEAIDRWRSASPGDGNHAFFRLGCQLAWIGINVADIRSTLWHEAAYGRHPSERRAQITYIMRSLRGSPTRLVA